MRSASRQHLVVGVLVVIAVLGAVIACDAKPMPTPAETPVPGVADRWSTRHVYEVRYESTPDPVPLLTLHAWTITIRDAAGQPVRQAKITVLGGMPAHAHGLPTSPEVRELGNGRYRVEGLKFHMPGSWIVAFRITASGGTDSVSFALDLP